MHTIRVLLPYDKLGLAAPMRERGSVQDVYKRQILDTNHRTAKLQGKSNSFMNSTRL